ncbi:MAG: hypothetical protein IKC56_02690 [Clostridia bacterium]|nr:hypothetical protein [Clostridia bacterium]
MILSITPILGAIYLLMIFFISYAVAVALQYFLLFLHREKKEPRPKQEEKSAPVYYVLEKRPAPKQKRTVKRRKPKPRREVYYLSTLQKQEESE